MADARRPHVYVGLRIRLRLRRALRMFHRATGAQYVRASLDGVLDHLASAGIRPATVIDVGAAVGDFSRESANVFPQAHFVLVEPLAECRAALNALRQRLASCEIVVAAAGRQPGKRTLNVHEDLVGSSLLLESESDIINGTPREVEIVRLDSLLEGRNWAAPFWLKLDVQGAELEVLDGAGLLLQKCSVLIIEVSLFHFFKGGPIVHEMISELARRGFVLYDIASLLYRPLDGALAQLDLVFVPEDSILRNEHAFMDPAHRATQSRRFLRHVSILTRVRKSENATLI